jgi:hypothetical protein
MTDIHDADDKSLRTGLQYARPNEDGVIAPFNVVTTPGDTGTDKSYVEEARSNVDNSNALDGKLQDDGSQDEALFDEETANQMSAYYGDDNRNKPGEGKGVTFADIDDGTDEFVGEVI